VAQGTLRARRDCRPGGAREGVDVARWLPWRRMHCERGSPAGPAARACGKLTAPTLAPTLTKRISALATSTPIAACASSVEPPMCGVRMTLGRRCSSARAARPPRHASARAAGACACHRILLNCLLQRRAPGGAQRRLNTPARTHSMSARYTGTSNHDQAHTVVRT